jgi:formate/nitrite transporter FocA (FNT family)
MTLSFWTKDFMGSDAENWLFVFIGNIIGFLSARMDISSPKR